ncbi:MAG: hypothetical protein GY714_09760 [Desulfobacterales bacterium]|nr:hypothetical protein [Desulfobacterales bacterium]
MKFFKEMVTFQSSLTHYDSYAKLGNHIRRSESCKLRQDRYEQPDQIHWICPACQDEGIVTGWEGLIWDMTDEPDNFQ